MSQAPESQDTSDIMRTCLNFLPQQTTERIISRLQQAIRPSPQEESGAGLSKEINCEPTQNTFWYEALSCIFMQNAACFPPAFLPKSTN